MQQMEYQCSPLSWEFYYQEEGLEELKQSLVYTTLELEATVVSAKEEITRKECELIHANDLLSRVIKERDEAKAKCHKLMLEKQELQQQLQHQQQQQLEHRQQLLQTNQRDTNSASENFSEKHNSVPTASSDCEENSMPSTDGSSSTPNPSPTTPLLQAVEELAEKKPLPEKGKLLKAVVEAGPLLQTLLLAGPLPQWQHPPPQLNSIEIPPVSIISSPNPKPSSLLLPQQDSTKAFSFTNNKRGLVFLSSGTDCSVSKCRKVIPPTTASHNLLPQPPSFS